MPQSTNTNQFRVITGENTNNELIVFFTNAKTAIKYMNTVKRKRLDGYFLQVKANGIWKDIEKI